MKNNIKLCQIGLLIVLFVSTITSCKINKPLNSSIKNTSSPFENHLIPAIQVESEPRFYNILKRMDYYKVPGFSIAIIEDGKIENAKGYGYARKQGKIPVDANTIFHAGSISKSVTALVVMKLRDKGLLILDEDVTNYLNSWKLPENKFTKQKPATLRTLLNHTSGIKTFNSKGYSTRETLPSLNDVLDGKAKEPAISIDTIPGSVYNYSSRGYSIIQRIIEDITSQKFENVAKNLIFDPLKMSNSTFEIIHPTNENINYSFSYNKEGNLNKGAWSYFPQKAAGGLKTTASDLGKLCIAIRNSLTAENGFLKMDSAKEMMEGENYGLGFDLKRQKNVFSFSHSGRVPGFFAYMIYYPKTNDGLVLLTNSDNGGKLFQEILRGFTELNSWNIIHPKRIKTIPISQETINKYVGNYILNLGDDSYEMQVKQDGANLCYTILGDNTILPLRALSDTEFIDIVEGEKFEFTDIKEKALKVISNSEYEFIRQE